MKETYPSLSLQERDRRWKLVREFMKTRELECVILAGLNSPQEHERYLANDRQHGIVVFPLEGEPIYLVRSNMYVVANIENLRRGDTSWIDDWRGGATGEVLVRVLKEKGFDSASIGVVGLKGLDIILEPEGWIPYALWAYVLDSLPNATFSDITRPFIDMVLVKGEEELRLVRQAAHIGEAACEVMLRVTKPGVSESDIYFAIMQAIQDNGGSAPLGLIIHSGKENPSWGNPRWLTKGERPRTVQKGEHVLVEMFPTYGGLQTQQQMTAALQPIDPMVEQLAQAAKRSNEIGLKMLRPGNSFEEVCDAMEEPIAEAGFWHLTPLIHSINPLHLISQRQVGMIDNLPGIDHINPEHWQKGEYKGIRARPITGGDTEIQAGMCFAMEPNACRGKQRVNIGGSVIVTDHGVENLNKLATEMRIAD